MPFERCAPYAVIDNVIKWERLCGIEILNFINENIISLRVDRRRCICYNIQQNDGRLVIVSISYKKLWKLLIDRDMTKMELRQAIGVSTATIARMSKGVPVSTEVMMKICNTLGCNLGDIVDVIKDESEVLQ